MKETCALFDCLKIALDPPLKMGESVVSPFKKGGSFLLPLIKEGGIFKDFFKWVNCYTKPWFSVYEINPCSSKCLSNPNMVSILWVRMVMKLAQSTRLSFLLPKLSQSS